MNSPFNRIRHLSQIQELDPTDFEHFVAHMLQRMGYAVEVTGQTGDEGVDLIARRDSAVAVVQCKRYRGTVAASVVRDLYGTMMHNHATEAWLVTSGKVSKQAREWAEGKPMYLFDGDRLQWWLDELNERHPLIDSDVVTRNQITFDWLWKRPKLLLFLLFVFGCLLCRLMELMGK